MAFSVILSPREHHNAKTPEDYRRIHATAIARKRRAGQRVTAHTVTDQTAARIDYGSWVIDCECGAGNSTDPEWGFALCFACGSEHTAIAFPARAARRVVEVLLLDRPQQKERFWSPGDDVAAIRAENAARGLGKK